jgi:hypothetical protein
VDFGPTVDVPTGAAPDDERASPDLVLSPAVRSKVVGLISKIFMELVQTAGGDDAVRQVKMKAKVPLEKDFKLNTVYDDREWRALVGAACEVLGITAEQAEAAYADFFFKDALNRWPMWFQMSKNSREFLLRQPAIHNSLAAGVSEEHQRTAVADKFNIDMTTDGLVTHYRSGNGHCGLYKALAQRVIDHYGDEARIEESRCVRRGDEECEIHVRWTSLKAA